MDFPQVYVMLVTYDRIDEIKRTIYALLKHIKYPRDKLLWHVSDDNTGDWYFPAIQKEFPYLRFTVTSTDRKGWGANVNKGMQYCFGKTDCVFLVEDDYRALKTVNLGRGVALLLSENNRHVPNEAPPRKPIGCIRYDGCEAHWLKLQLREADTQIGPVHYMHILHNSPFLNCYSNRPHLKHRRFHDAYGIYDEGISLADTESSFAHRVKQASGKPWLVLLQDGVEKAFSHEGKSRQGTNLDNQKG